MVARIAILKRLLDAINYNEKKVEKGSAECIYAGNYLQHAKDMNFYQKLVPLKSLEELNTRAITKTLHASLNFDPTERLEKDRLIQIAETYMTSIGFGEQPFLVYRHEDAGHPHIHIVSTAIKADGSRINTHNIGKSQSEKARKEIESAFVLVKASKKNPDRTALPQPISIQKAIYGKSETKRSISNIVNKVFNQYCFTSLPEFNAALRQFNVIADVGKEGSRINKNHGLLFRIIDDSGNKLGVPIKASIITGKPTLANLQLKFEESAERKQTLKPAIKKIIDECISQEPGNTTQLINLLKQKNVYILQRFSADGRSYGITFVDNINKCVFNGSDIGRGYTIAGLHEHFSRSDASAASFSESAHITNKVVENCNTIKADVKGALLNPMQQFENTPHEFRKKKKKKRKTDNN